MFLIRVLLHESFDGRLQSYRMDSTRMAFLDGLFTLFDLFDDSLDNELQRRTRQYYFAPLLYASSFSCLFFMP